jgi:probable O-glycosylation ligase (exosortase A-associated)
VYLLFALWGFFCLTTFTAINQVMAWDKLNQVSKIFLMTLVAMKLLQDPKRVRAFLWVIVLSIGFYGVKGGIWALGKGSSSQVLGPPGSFIAGNTEIGLALNMVLPILIFLRREDRRPWVRAGLLAAILLSIVAILSTWSRGAFLGLGVVLFLLLVKGRRKVLLVPLMSAGLLISTNLLPVEWFERMETIPGSVPQEDDAPMAGNPRLHTWKLSYLLALDHPLVGAGFRPFTWETFTKYMPEYLEVHRKPQDAHSIFFQVLAEHGFIGLALWVGLLVATWRRLRRLRRQSRGDPSRRWIFNCCDMLEVSLAGYVVSGIFLSLSYFDLYYYIVAVPSILQTFMGDGKERRDGGPEEATHQPGPARAEANLVHSGGHPQDGPPRVPRTALRRAARRGRTSRSAPGPALGREAPDPRAKEGRPEPVPSGLGATGPATAGHGEEGSL